MEYLYGTERKALKYIFKFNKKSTDISIYELSKILKLNINEISDVCNSLRNKKYIEYVGLNYKLKLLPKGADYFKFENDKWLSQNIIAILALVISLLAFINSLQ